VSHNPAKTEKGRLRRRYLVSALAGGIVAALVVSVVPVLAGGSVESGTAPEPRAVGGYCGDDVGRPPGVTESCTIVVKAPTAGTIYMSGSGTMKGTATCDFRLGSQRLSESIRKVTVRKDGAGVCASIVAREFTKGKHRIRFTVRPGKNIGPGNFSAFAVFEAR
jgi:hypothetical protein